MYFSSEPQKLSVKNAIIQLDSIKNKIQKNKLGYLQDLICNDLTTQNAYFKLDYKIISLYEINRAINQDELKAYLDNEHLKLSSFVTFDYLKELLNEYGYTYYLYFYNGGYPYIINDMNNTVNHVVNDLINVIIK